MKQTFTASEVRERAKTFGAGDIYCMLTAYADMLETREKAKALGTCPMHGVEYVGECSGCAMTLPEKDFTHLSAQAQPPAASVPEMTGLTWEPPNVTVDVERVGRFRSGDEHIVIVTFRSSDDGRRMTCFYSANKSAAEYLHAMLATQEESQNE